MVEDMTPEEPDPIGESPAIKKTFHVIFPVYAVMNSCVALPKDSFEHFFKHMVPSRFLAAQQRWAALCWTSGSQPLEAFWYFGWGTTGGCPFSFWFLHQQNSLFKLLLPLQCSLRKTPLRASSFLSRPQFLPFGLQWFHQI